MDTIIPKDIIIHHIVPYLPVAMLYVNKEINKVCKDIIDNLHILDFSDEKLLYGGYRRGDNLLVYKIILAFRYGDVTNAVRMFRILDKKMKPSWFDILCFSSCVSNKKFKRYDINRHQIAAVSDIDPGTVYSYIKDISNREYSVYKQYNILSDTDSKTSTHTLIELDKLSKSGKYHNTLSEYFRNELNIYVKGENTKYFPSIGKLFDESSWKSDAVEVYKFLERDDCRKLIEREIKSNYYKDMNKELMKFGLENFPELDWISYWNNLKSIDVISGKSLFQQLYNVSPFTSYSALGGFFNSSDQGAIYKNNMIINYVYSLNEQMFKDEFMYLMKDPNIRHLLLNSNNLRKFEGISEENTINLICELTLKELEKVYTKLMSILNIDDKIVEKVRIKSPINGKCLYDGLYPDTNIYNLFD